jgi:hypothetical protein
MRKLEKLTKQYNQLRGELLTATDAERDALQGKIRELKLEISLATPATSGRRYR